MSERKVGMEVVLKTPGIHHLNGCRGKLYSVTPNGCGVKLLEGGNVGESVFVAHHEVAGVVTPAIDTTSKDARSLLPVEAVSMFKCRACGTVYSTVDAAARCAAQPDPMLAFTEWAGWAPQPGTIVQRAGAYAWVRTSRPEWHSAEKVKGNGLHNGDTWTIYYVVTGTRLENHRRENVFYPGFQNHGCGPERINRHHLIVNVATRAFDNDEKGKLVQPFGSCGWISLHHLRLEAVTNPNPRLVEQAAELVDYWTRPENEARVGLL
jgi:hypothetical protein